MKLNKTEQNEQWREPNVLTWMYSIKVQNGLARYSIMKILSLQYQIKLPQMDSSNPCPKKLLFYKPILTPIFFVVIKRITTKSPKAKSISSNVVSKRFRVVSFFKNNKTTSNSSSKTRGAAAPPHSNYLRVIR